MRETQTDGQTSRQTDRLTGRQADKQIGRQAGRQTGRQAGRQTVGVKKKLFRAAKSCLRGRKLVSV